MSDKLYITEEGEEMSPELADALRKTVQNPNNNVINIGAPCYTNVPIMISDHIPPEPEGPLYYRLSLGKTRVRFYPAPWYRRWWWSIQDFWDGV